MHHGDISTSASSNTVNVGTRDNAHLDFISLRNRDTPATEARFNRVYSARAWRLVSSRVLKGGLEWTRAKRVRVRVPRLAASNLIYSRPPCLESPETALGESGRERETARGSNETLTREREKERLQREKEERAKRVDKREGTCEMHEIYLTVIYYH